MTRLPSALSRLTPPIDNGHSTASTRRRRSGELRSSGDSQESATAKQQDDHRPKALRTFSRKDSPEAEGGPSVTPRDLEEGVSAAVPARVPAAPRPVYRSFEAWVDAATPESFSPGQDGRISWTPEKLKSEIEKLIHHTYLEMRGAEGQLARQTVAMRILGWTFIPEDISISPEMRALWKTIDDGDPAAVKFVADKMRNSYVALKNATSQATLRRRDNNQIDMAATREYRRTAKSILDLGMGQLAALEVETSALGRWARFATHGPLSTAFGLTLAYLNVINEFQTGITEVPTQIRNIIQAIGTTGADPTSTWRDAAHHWGLRQGAYAIPTLLWSPVGLLPAAAKLALPNSERVEDWAQWSVRAQTPGNRQFFPVIATVAVLNILGYLYVFNKHRLLIDGIKAGVSAALRPFGGGLSSVAIKHGGYEIDEPTEPQPDQDADALRERDIDISKRHIQEIQMGLAVLQTMAQKGTTTGHAFREKVKVLSESVEDLIATSEHVMGEITKVSPYLLQLMNSVENLIERGDPEDGGNSVEYNTKLLYTALHVTALVSSGLTIAASARDIGNVVDQAIFSLLANAALALETTNKNSLPVNVMSTFALLFAQQILMLPANIANFIYGQVKKKDIFDLTRVPKPIQAPANSTSSSAQLDHRKRSADDGASDPRVAAALAHPDLKAAIEAFGFDPDLVASATEIYLEQKAIAQKAFGEAEAHSPGLDHPMPSFASGQSEPSMDEIVRSIMKNAGAASEASSLAETGSQPDAGPLVRRGAPGPFISDAPALRATSTSPLSSTPSPSRLPVGYEGSGSIPIVPIYATTITLVYLFVATLLLTHRLAPGVAAIARFMAKQKLPQGVNIPRQQRLDSVLTFHRLARDASQAPVDAQPLDDGTGMTGIALGAVSSKGEARAVALEGEASRSGAAGPVDDFLRSLNWHDIPSEPVRRAAHVAAQADWFIAKSGDDFPDREAFRHGVLESQATYKPALDDDTGRAIRFPPEA
jgi:hypothetical protein